MKVHEDSISISFPVGYSVRANIRVLGVRTDFVNQMELDRPLIRDAHYNVRLSTPNGLMLGLM